MKVLIVTLAVIQALSPVALARCTSELERRVAELEKKMHLIDPAFGREPSAQDLLGRLTQLEQKLDAVLAERQWPQTAQVAAATAPSATPQSQRPTLVPVSVIGDYQTAPNGETRLAVAGYMDLHGNGISRRKRTIQGARRVN